MTSENISLSHSSNQQYVCSPKLLSRWTDGAECYFSCPYCGISDRYFPIYSVICGRIILERRWCLTKISYNIIYKYIFNVAGGAIVCECNNVVQEFGDFVLRDLSDVCLVLANVYFCCYVLSCYIMYLI